MVGSLRPGEVFLVKTPGVAEQVTAIRLFKVTAA
jgi:hypothetical protein